MLNFVHFLRIISRKATGLSFSLFSSGEVLNAEEAFNNALLLDSTLQDARLGHARAMLKLGRAEAAIEDCDQLLKNAPEEREILIEKSRALTAHGDYREAVKLLVPLGRKYTRNATIHFELGRAFAGLNYERSSNREFETALRSDPSLASEVTNERLKMGRRIAEARNDALSRGLGPRSDRVHPLMREMELAEATSRGSRSGDRATAGSPSLSGDANSMVAAGYSSLQSGMVNSAIKQLTAAVKARPNDISARRYLAQAFAIAKRPDEASEQFNAIWAATSWSAEEELLLGDSFARCGRLDRAIVSYQQCVSKVAGGPQRSKALFSLAQTYFRSGLKLQATEAARQGKDSAGTPEEAARFQQLLSTIQANPH
jgi:tetratricopeptide (TPR) repeat protein